MKTMRFPAIAAFMWLNAIMLAPVTRAEDVGDLSDKLDRVERDLRELQYEVYKGNPPAPTPGHTGGVPSSPSANGARLNDLEESLRDIRGQVETMAFQIKQLNEQLELSRKETNFRLGALEGGAPVAAIAAPPASAAAAQRPQKSAPDANAGSTLAGRQGGTLGSLPSSDMADAPSATLTPRQQYDAAMELLSRAQYPEAQSAFRSFVATNPKDELAGPAQYWVGEISFTQKDYKAAAGSFADVVKRFSRTAKAPDAMLKLGLSLMELGQKKEACTTLGAIKTRFPNASKTTLDRAAKRAAEAKCS
ncbi:MAG: tol-pal system protein YbgF [Micropepsaceae bacterium]